MGERERAILNRAGAMLKGHFLLSSGLHSDTYFQMALVYQNPVFGEELTRLLAEKFSGEKMDVVIGPALGGVIISYELGRILRTRTVFAEREAGVMTLRRGFDIKEGERVLVCEDVITTGGSVREVIRVVEDRKGIIIGVGCIVQRGKVDLGYHLKPLVSVEVKQYQPDACPLCKEGVPCVKPGSRNLPKAGKSLPF